MSHDWFPFCHLCQNPETETLLCQNTGRFYFVEMRGLEPNIRPVPVQQSIRRVGPTQLLDNWLTRTIRSGI
jgi:hypothetical protein